MGRVIGALPDGVKRLFALRTMSHARLFGVLSGSVKETDMVKSISGWKRVAIVGVLCVGATVVGIWVQAAGHRVIICELEPLYLGHIQDETYEAP